MEVIFGDIFSGIYTICYEGFITSPDISRDHTGLYLELLLESSTIIIFSYISILTDRNNNFHRLHLLYNYD